MALPDITIKGATVVADPELRYTPQGAAVANFRVASNSRRFNKNTRDWEDGLSLIHISEPTRRS